MSDALVENKTPEAPVLMAPSIDDGYTEKATFAPQGYTPVTVVYRPITKGEWREHYRAKELQPEALKETYTDEFCVSHIKSWSLKFPITVATFDKLRPDELATAILNHLGGRLSTSVGVQVQADLGNS